MLTLYGHSYAKSDRQAVASLFHAGGTVNGLYRVTRSGIYLSDLTGEERAFIRKDGLGPVSVSRRDDGRRVFAFSTSSRDDKWLGRPESYAATCEGARAIADQLFRANGGQP